MMSANRCTEEFKSDAPSQITDLRNCVKEVPGDGSGSAQNMTYFKLD